MGFREEEITIEANSPAELELKKRQLQDCAKKTIFRDPPKDSLWHSKAVKLFQWFIKKGDAFLIKTCPEQRRFNFIHMFLKNKVFHRVFPLLQRFTKKYLVKNINDIRPDWYNNHARIFYHCWELGLKDMWKKMIWSQIQLSGQKSNYKNADEFYHHVKYGERRSYTARMMIMQLWITEVLEDTVDREFMNFFMLRMYHTLHKFYNGNVPKPGEYPMFLAGTGYNPKYFFDNIGKPVWQPDEIDWFDEDEVREYEYKNKLKSEQDRINTGRKEQDGKRNDKKRKSNKNKKSA